MHLSNASEVPKVTGRLRHLGLAHFVLKIKEIVRIGSITLWISRLLRPRGPNRSVWSPHTYARKRPSSARNGRRCHNEIHAGPLSRAWMYFGGMARPRKTLSSGKTAHQQAKDAPKGVLGSQTQAVINLWSIFRLLLETFE
jgi:hypothetical protein